MLETVAAIGIMATAVAIGAQAAQMTAQQRRSEHERAVALQEAANAMERLSAAQWDEITQTHLAEMRLSDEAAALLPESSLAATVVDGRDGELATKRLAVTVAWRAGGAQRKIALTHWRFQNKEQP